jgi:hypothetical protein
MAHNAPSFWHNLGQKVNTGIQMAATAKHIYDAGKMVYAGMQAAAPIVAGIVSTAALL